MLHLDDSDGSCVHPAKVSCLCALPWKSKAGCDVKKWCFQEIACECLIRDLLAKTIQEPKKASLLGVPASSFEALFILKQFGIL